MDDILARLDRIEAALWEANALQTVEELRDVLADVRELRSMLKFQFQECVSQTSTTGDHAGR